MAEQPWHGRFGVAKWGMIATLSPQGWYRQAGSRATLQGQMGKTMSNTDPRAMPAGFADEEELEEFMTRPSDALVRDLEGVEGDILILGVSGKMGPTLARMAKRAVPDRRVIGVARFSDPAVATKLENWGVETITCDLEDRDAVAALPKCPNVIFMAGRKFGTSGALSLTWAMNVAVPAIAAEVFRGSRIVAFSSGNIYRFGPVAAGGSIETDPPEAVGEYAQSCLGRERIFEHFSQKHGTPGRNIRLNYAIDMRYGVLHDIASKVLAGEPIDLTTGNVNVIWQGDANSHILRCLAHCTTPASPLNVTGPETVSVRAVALAFGDRFGKAPVFQDTESDRCWLVNAGEAARLFGNPAVPLLTMVDWVADWLQRGGSDYGKPTGYGSRDGRF